MAFTFTTPSRESLAAFIQDGQTVQDFEALFDAVLALMIATTGKLAAPGDIVFSAGTTRVGAILADGTSYLRTAYPDLFAAIGTVYGAADGTHFNVPDVTGRVLAGKEAAATRITTAVSGFSGATLGAAGGLQSHTLITAEMPAHTHTALQNAAGTQLVIGAGFAVNTQAGGSTGGGGAHRNVQPTIIMNAFIVY